VIPLTPSLTPKEYRALAKKRHKYGTADASQRTYAGRVYDSAKEMRRAQELDILLQDETIQAWWPQITFKLTVNGQLICRYVADFKVLYFDGRVEYEEVKGFETKEWKLKYKLFRALYPNVTLVVIK